MSRVYPDEPADDFPRPPRTVTDGEGREISFAAVDAGATEELTAMYEQFDPADRAQGIPPARTPAIERWLDTILEADCLNVVARYDGDAIGHATLVPDNEGDYELAIFVLGDYQGAGIGTTLLESLLGHAQSAGIERVWLTVERWNDAAIRVYRKVGFETASSERFEMEMAILL